jgi:phosphoglycerate dehydrogenase-like enzyme
LETLVIAGAQSPNHLARLGERFPAVRVVQVEGAPRPADVAEADAIITWTLPADVLAAAPRLGWLQSVGAGVEGFPLAELAARGIIVTNASGVHATNMAEHALALMLAFARGLPPLGRAQSARQWRDDETRGEIFELAGQTVLLVGLGRIATAIAARAAAFGMRVIGVRRRPELAPPPDVAAVLPIERLHEGLAEADHVVVIVPHTPLTVGLIDAAALAAMKPGAYLYNLGRGPVVDSAALIAALSSGHLGGAGIDVTAPEPLPADSPLWSLPNVLITAHTAGATPRYWERAFPIFEENIARYLAGEPLRNRVDLAAGY